MVGAGALDAPYKSKTAPGIIPQVRLKMVIVREMLHNILNTALENIAQTINRIHFHIFVLTQTVNLRTIYIVMRVQGILGDIAFFHCFPKAIILYHPNKPHFLIDVLLLLP